MEFTTQGEEVLVSVHDDNQVVVYDKESFNQLERISAEKPSDIFFSSHAHRMSL